MSDIEKNSSNRSEVLNILSDLDGTGCSFLTYKYNGIDPLISKLENKSRNYNVEKIREAFLYADQLHEGQFRQSGEPYISHPVAVAEIVADLDLDTDSVCAALLHDTVEDCGTMTDLEIIKQKFGQSVALLVDGLTKIVHLEIEDKEEAHIENLRKMLLAMSKDIRVIFIKLCDRLHNMRTLQAKKDEKRRSIALETMYVYAPLAHRLGMQKIKQELENISLYYLDPIGCEEVKRSISDKYGQSSNVLENARLNIEEKLSENNINFRIEGRIKSVYSLYRKMYKQSKAFDEIYDFYALRVIVDTELECYTTLGIIHEMFKSVPGRFKDYISTPKPNLYRSLHTTVIGRDGVPFEVQIRTKEMHEIAEYGIAAHWKYKSGEKSNADFDKRLAWVSQLLETEGDTNDPDEFMHAFKTDIFNDETFVFTPKGDVIALPYGSTVIDFAYEIHTQVGNKMIGAKINGMIVPIDKIPSNGEIVEIITSSSSKGPSRDWLKIVKTSGARTKIRQWFKKEKRPENIIVGKNEIDKELKKLGKAFTEQQRNEAVEIVAKRIGYQEKDDFYNTIGYGGLSVSKISNKLKEELEKIITVEPSPTYTEADVKTVLPKNITKNSGIVVDGEKGCAVKFANCCNPLPGDEIIGFVTRGYGVSIHKLDCPNAINGSLSDDTKSRWVEAHWEHDFIGGSDNSVYEALIALYAEDRFSLLADTSVALVDMHVSIMSVNSQKRPNGHVVLNYTVACKNIAHYRAIVSRLRQIKGVISVTRGFS